MGRRVIGIPRSLIWSKTLTELIFNPPLVNFGEVMRAQFAKFTLCTSTWCPWDLFRSFNVWSDGVQKVTGSNRTYSSVVKLQPWFLSLQWRSAFGQNCNVGSYFSSERAVLEQNTMMIMYTKRQGQYTSMNGKCEMVLLKLWISLKGGIHHRHICIVRKFT